MISMSSTDEEAMTVMAIRFCGRAASAAGGTL